MMGKYILWAFWSLVYLVRRSPREQDYYLNLDFHLKRSIRTRKPWWKWKPSAWHNIEGRQWEVTLSDEDSFTRRVAIPDCEIAIGRESGRIVGVTLFDEILQRPDECPKWFGPNEKYKSA